MEYKYNFNFKNINRILYVYTHIFPVSNFKKEYKLLFQQYYITELDNVEFLKQKKLYINNILLFKNNILIVKIKNNIKNKNAFNKLWFYCDPNNIYNDIINSYDNKLIKFNNKLYNFVIGDFKFKDIFILLYNNE